MNTLTISKFLKKIQAIKKSSRVDLTSSEDLSLAIMNLVSIEEHFFFTAEKTAKVEYFDLLKKVREMRKELLAKIVKEPEGEIWCISKHLLAASMRLIEVGTKTLGEGNKKEAQALFAKAYELYNLFWGLNLKLINVGKIKQINESKLTNVWGKLGEIIKKIVNCCIE